MIDADWIAPLLKELCIQNKVQPGDLPDGYLPELVELYVEGAISRKSVRMVIDVTVERIQRKKEIEAYVDQIFWIGDNRPDRDWVLSFPLGEAWDSRYRSRVSRAAHDPHPFRGLDLQRTS